MSFYAEWAEQLTEMGKGKHFIGDFLPPEELEKFMETFKALKVRETYQCSVEASISPYSSTSITQIYPHPCQLHVLKCSYATLQNYKGQV